MNTLAICQIFNPSIHGVVEDEPTTPEGHHLALHTYDDEYDDSPYAFLNFWTEPRTPEEQDAERSAILGMQSSLDDVASLRELRSIPKVDIVETRELPSGHLVAIKKTVWLSIFQRMLKKRYASGSVSRKRARYD